MVKRLLILSLAIALLFGSYLQIYAEDENSIPDEFFEIEDFVPDEVTDELPDGLFSDDPNDVIAAVESMSSFDYILGVAFDALGLNVSKIIRNAGILICILIMCSLINSLKKTISNEGASAVLSLVGAAIFIAALYEITEEPLRRALALFDQMKIFVNTVTPVICSMYAMGGNVSTAIVNNYGLLVFLAILENVIILSLEIILGTCMALTFAQGFIGGTNLQGLSQGIKKGFTFFISFIMLIFTTVISTQTLLASKADSLSTRTARMIASQVIPVVGSSVGESLRTAGASMEYLRSHVGIAIIIIFIVMVMPSLISVASYRIMLIGVHSVSGLLGCEREGRIALELSSIYGYVLAVLAISAVILLLLLTIFAKCSSPLA